MVLQLHKLRTWLYAHHVTLHQLRRLAMLARLVLVKQQQLLLLLQLAQPPLLL